MSAMTDMRDNPERRFAADSLPEEPFLLKVTKTLPRAHQLLFILALAKAENEGIRLGEGETTLNAHYRQACSFMFDLLRGRRAKPQEMKRVIRMITGDQELCQRASFDPTLKNAAGIHACMPAFSLLGDACAALRDDGSAAVHAWETFMDTVTANFYILMKVQNDVVSEVLEETDDEVLGDRCWEEFLKYEQHCPESQSVFHHLSLIVDALSAHAFAGADDKTLRGFIDGDRAPSREFGPLPEKLINQILKLTEEMMAILPGYEAIMHHLMSRGQARNVMMNGDDQSDS